MTYYRATTATRNPNIPDSESVVMCQQEVGANNNNFTGPFPDQFCSPDCFKFIQKIDFSYGTISGLLPSCISEMPWLEEFKLQNNQVR